MLGQLDLYERVHKLTNGKSDLTMKIFGTESDESQTIKTIKSKVLNKDFAIDLEVRYSKFSDKEIRELINKAEAFLWSPLSISYAECSSLYLQSILLSGKVILTNDIGIKSSSSFDTDFSSQFINIDGLDANMFYQKMKKFQDYKTRIFNQEDILISIKSFYRNLF